MTGERHCLRPVRSVEPCGEEHEEQCSGPAGVAAPATDLGSLISLVAGQRAKVFFVAELGRITDIQESAEGVLDEILLELNDLENFPNER